MVGGYNDQIAHSLYLSALTAQNVGDVAGRLATVFVSGKPGVLIAWLAVLISTFLMMLLLVFDDKLIINLFGDGQGIASAVIITITLVYYFSRGLLVTSLYLRARTMEKAVAEYLGVNMGFYGQMGALSANLVTITVVSIAGTS